MGRFCLMIMIGEDFSFRLSFFSSVWVGKDGWMDRWMDEQEGGWVGEGDSIV